MLRIKDMQISERPRERLVKYGQESLSNAELIAIVLRTGTKDENAVAVANNLLRKYPLSDLASRKIIQMRKINGIGLAKACQLVACFELGKRASVHSYEKISIKSSKDAIKMLEPEMENLDKEHFAILILDIRNNVIKKEKIFIGTLDNSIIHPREIFKPAIIESASAIILVHNHPSGDPSPSREDIEVTGKLKEAGKILGIDVLDHIIIGKGKSYSMLDNGLV